MNSSYLNLARKWRSKNFDQIVGQELSVKMLKNSLYLNHYFPVYLFAGQKGCGKTTTARVFAAAVNCEQLPTFQQQPRKTMIPCLTCNSCVAMQAGNHPDFMEIDAASNTGVDNVRSIIDAASFLPIMGRKKIYLIDEAHMLSKAAFNAFLKILEEPPVSVLFMLATTDTQKIIETVRSRSFQLFFKSVAPNLLFDHLVHIAHQEKISYEDDGLQTIIRETGGSVRDALNLLEQVRFSHSCVTQKAVLSVLGHLDDSQLVHLLRLSITGNASEVLNFLNTIQFQSLSAEYVWHQIIELVRALLWVKHGLEPRFYKEHMPVLKQLSTQCSWQRLHGIMDLLYTRESIFLKTTAQHAYLEMILLIIAQQSTASDSGNSSSNQSSPAGLPPVVGAAQQEDMVEEDAALEFITALPAKELQANDAQRWISFIESLAQLQDPLVTSIFAQASLRGFDAVSGKLDVELSKELVFFQDWLDTTKGVWQPLLKKNFSENAVLIPSFTGASAQVVTPQAPRERESQQVAYQSAPKTSNPVAKPAYQFKKEAVGSRHTNSPVAYSTKGVVDVSDEHMWKKAALLMRYFPGTVYELPES